MRGALKRIAGPPCTALAPDQGRDESGGSALSALPGAHV